MAPAATASAQAADAAVAGKTASSRIQPDPEVVKYPSFEVDPSTPEEFYQWAEQVSELLHQDEAIRDRGNVIPYRQVQLLKDLDLVTLLGPKSLGQLLGYHYLWFGAAALVGTDDQRKRIADWLTRNKYFIGDAVNPRDSDLKATQHPEDASKLVFTGKKTFSTGSKVSDVTILKGSLADGKHVFAAVLSKQEGIVYRDEWVDTLGMRGTQSGDISINNVVVPWEDALGYVDKQFVALGAYNALNLPQIQLLFTAFYLGIAEGALARGLAYTKANTRGWPYTPSPASRGTDEAYIQMGYGDLQARLWASQAQIEQVIEQASTILDAQPRQSVTVKQRAHFAVRVAATKVNAVDFGLEITSQMYELAGTRAVSGKYGFDVAWRDLRTHSLHDPIAHKRAEVERYALHGPGQDGWPTPTWYT